MKSAAYYLKTGSPENQECNNNKNKAIGNEYFGKVEAAGKVVDDCQNLKEDHQAYRHNDNCFPYLLALVRCQEE